MRLGFAASVVGSGSVHLEAGYLWTVTLVAHSQPDHVQQGLQHDYAQRLTHSMGLRFAQYAVFLPGPIPTDRLEDHESRSMHHGCGSYRQVVPIG
eukprot:717150-Amphidinium_carterae.2